MRQFVRQEGLPRKRIRLVRSRAEVNFVSSCKRTRADAVHRFGRNTVPVNGYPTEVSTKFPAEDIGDRRRQSFSSRGIERLSHLRGKAVRNSPRPRLRGGDSTSRFGTFFSRRMQSNLCK